MRSEIGELDYMDTPSTSFLATIEHVQCVRTAQLFSSDGFGVFACDEDSGKEVPLRRVRII
jgi:hypothetical protein